MAAVFAAGMSTLASDLNCLSAVGVEDYYRKLRPDASDARRLFMGKIIVGVCGLDLAGHREVVPDRPPGEQGRQRGGDRHPRRGAVLGHRSGGNVDVEVHVFEEVGRDAQALRARSDVAQRGLRRLLHHVAQVSGQRQALLARHFRGLDENDVAPHRRPDQADRHPRLLRAFGQLEKEPLRPEELAHLLGVDGDRLRLSLGDPPRHLAAEAPDLALEVAETGFPCAALVPNSSPISQSGIMFYNTLFDENASCHLALGNAYRTSIKGGDDMSDEEFAASGGNKSLIHVDFMIGSGKLDIDGICSDGSVDPVMRSGEWAFEV